VWTSRACPRWSRYRSSVATPRFLQLSDVAEILNCSASQVYALVRNEELPAVKIGGRGQWRVEASKLEEYIERMYQQTQQWVKAHPYGGDDDEADPQ
jgi:excisionase family DNA binding protein